MCLGSTWLTPVELRNEGHVVGILTRHTHVFIAASLGSEQQHEIYTHRCEVLVNRFPLQFLRVHVPDESSISGMSP